LDREAICVVRLIDSLQAVGVIERHPHPHDRRIRTLCLTEAAQPILEQVLAVRTKVRAQAIAGMTDADQARLLDLLMTVRGNLAQPERRRASVAMRDGEELPCAKGDCPEIGEMTTRAI
jgi:MarR family transcriptional regulator, transcriptional regulator for hemolysin